jgi:hypothetical protein
VLPTFPLPVIRVSTSELHVNDDNKAPIIENFDARNIILGGNVEVFNCPKFDWCMRYGPTEPQRCWVGLVQEMRVWWQNHPTHDLLEATRYATFLTTRLSSVSPAEVNQMIYRLPRISFRQEFPPNPMMMPLVWLSIIIMLQHGLFVTWQYNSPVLQRVALRDVPWQLFSQRVCHPVMGNYLGFDPQQLCWSPGIDWFGMFVLYIQTWSWLPLFLLFIVWR